MAREIEASRECARCGFVEIVFIEGFDRAESDGFRAIENIPEALRAHFVGIRVFPGVAHAIVEIAHARGIVAVRHGFIERELPVQNARFNGVERALHSAVRRIEQALCSAEIVHGRNEQVDGRECAVRLHRHEGVHFPNGLQGALARMERLFEGAVGANGASQLAEQHHLVVFAFDFGVDFAFLAAVEPVDARIANGVLLAIHKRVHGSVERIVAQEAQRIGATHGHFVFLEHLQAFLQRGDEFAGGVVVHDAAQSEEFLHARRKNEVEQRIGALVAQQERIFLVDRFADDVRMRGIDVLAEEIVGKNCRHDASLSEVWRGAFYGELTLSRQCTRPSVGPMIYNRSSVFSAAPRTLRKLLFWASLPRKKEARMSAMKLTKREKSWIVYDVGNSAFVLLASTLIPIYFSAIADPGSSVVVAWGYATTVASLLLALLMPFLGSIADLKGNKKRLLVGSIGTGAVLLACMGIPGNAMVFLVMYVVATIMLNASLVFYDAFLIDATDSEDRYDEVSSQGYAWGYIGSCVPFIICLVLVLFGESFGLGQLDAIRISFVITAVWWVVFSVPVLKNVHQTHYKERTEHLFRDALVGLWATAKRIFADKRVFMFMLAFFFYIDGVHTIITMSTSYGTDLGIGSTQLVLALLVTQFVAFPSAIAYGRLAGKFGTKRMLLIAIFAYFCITLFAAFFLRSATEFWVLAVCVGLFQGGIQALSRSEFGKLIPKEHANEYYGFFDIFGKYATVLGTLLVSVFTQITGNSSIGVLSIAVLFIVGFVLMTKVPEK